MASDGEGDGWAGVGWGTVVGAAHCSLAHYWHPKLDKTEFTVYQASHRGGTLTVRIISDRVLLTGHAATVLRGTLEVE